MSLNLKEWIAQVSAFIQQKRYAITFHSSANVQMKMVNSTVTSNGSALINLNALGVNTNNAYGIVAVCTTSNYRFSTPILWSNGDYYVTLFNWNNATPVANKQVSMILTWFYNT